MKVTVSATQMACTWDIEANGAVIVPGYGYGRDAEALETYAGLYPDREIAQPSPIR